MPGIFPRQTDFNITVDSGDLMVEITPPTAGTLTLDELTYILTGTTIAAGKSEVRITNLGGSIDVGGVSGAVADITVNTKTLAPDNAPLIIKKNFDRVNNVEELTPAITIVNASGAAVRIEVFS